jgi:hypothetical protein
MPIGIENTTISSVNFLQTSGTDISLSHPTVEILFTPDPGYFLDASYLSLTESVVEFSDVTFTQAGTNVLLTATFLPGFVMPANDLDISLCIAGKPSASLYTVIGTLNDEILVNASNSVLDYNQSANYNSEVIVTTFSVTADPGYYFPVVPELILTSGDINNYNIIYTTNVDVNGLIESVDYEIYYVFPNYSVLTDSWQIIARAAEIYVPVVEITSYKIDMTNIPQDGETKVLTLYGNEGAAFNVLVDSVGLYQEL